MNKYRLYVFTIFFFCSCKMVPNSDRQFATIDENKIYKLHLHPDTGSKYYYNISNKTAIKVEINEAKIDNVNTTTVGVSYAIAKDSLGDFVVTMVYDKIKISSKTPDTETAMDADNAALTINPVEKMLGMLKAANIVATVSPGGKVKSLTGYQALTAKVMEELGKSDMYTRATAQKQWDQFVEKGVVKNNLDQMFTFFPDSAVHIGDRWKLDVTQNEEMGLVAQSSFQLKSIEDNVATITSSGDINSGGKSAELMGQQVILNLKGEQTGGYQMDTKTGMLLKSNLKATVNGTMKVLDKEIPINIETSIQLDGNRIN